MKSSLILFFFYFHLEYGYKIFFDKYEWIKLEQTGIYLDAIFCLGGFKM